MLSLLPDYADPVRLCGLGRVYEGTIDLAEMPRLVELLADPAGEVRFRLGFGRDEHQRSIVEVSVAATLSLECQRCLGRMQHEVASSTRLAVVQGPIEAERLPDDLDPLILEGERIALRDLLDEELILAIPNAPAHQVDECGVDLRQVNTTPAAGSSPAQSRSPFAALAGLKRERDRND